MQPATTTATAPTGAEYKPLTSLLGAVTPAARNEIARRVTALDRRDLVQRYRAAFANGKRLAAYVMAGELIERGIPPCFWHEVLALDCITVNQRADLLVSDLAWLRRWHPDHASVVRYRRGKALLTGTEAVFLREAEFAFYQGKRPAWKLVNTWSLTERQQWEAAYLRSMPIRKQATATEAMSGRVLKALQEDVRTTRRTAIFGETEALATLRRRHALWLCARMVFTDSPTEIATRYQQMTGTPITRQNVAKQLEKVRDVLRKKGADFTTDKRAD